MFRSTRATECAWNGFAAPWRSRMLNLRATQCGAVTFVQRFGDALNANPHFHSIAIDGVYAAGEDGRPKGDTLML